MMYLFTGNNRYLIQQEAKKWKLAFGEKFGVENVIHISSLESVSKDQVQEALLARGIFTEKRLVLIDGYPFSGERSFSGASDMESLILQSLEKVPEEVLVVFLSESPDKRTIGYKTLSKLADVKKFSVEGENEVYQILSKKYGSYIEPQAIQTLIHLKGGDLQKSISEIDKLRITKEYISTQDINTVIIPEFEESIFVFIDTLLSKNKQKLFSEFQNLLSFSNMYALYQSILANLRVFLYIEFLKSQKKSSQQIGDILKLGNRQFLINKRHKSSYQSIQKLYFNLLAFDKNMKFGKFVSSDEEDMKRELERIFLKFLA